MKKFIFCATFALVGLIISSCTKAISKLPTDDIGLAGGFAHCAKNPSYWLFLVLAVIAGGAIGYFASKHYAREGDAKNWPYFVALFLILAALFMAPCEVGFNTTVEQAGRGVYIGF